MKHILLRPRSSFIVKTLRLLSVTLALATTTHSLWACSVPVFAYALRRWAHDPHLLVTQRDAGWINHQQAQAAASSAGVTLIPADPTLSPGLYTKYDQPAWLSGEVPEDRIPSLLDSPARQELVRRLLAGDSVVWLHLAAKDDPAADAAEARLRDRLAYLASITVLAPLDPADLATMRTMREPGPALRLAFSIQRIDADSPAEWALAAQLRAQAGPDNPPGSLFAPVFGRGRAYAAQAAASWTDEIIDQTTQFLTSACSCQIKSLNPGVDLLLSVNWEEKLLEVNAPWKPEKPTDPATSPALPAKPEIIIFSPSPATPAPAPKP